MNGAWCQGPVRPCAVLASREHFHPTTVDRNLALEVVRVTEAAALSAARFVGLGDRDGADRAAVEAMRRTFGYMHIRGRSSSARASVTRRQCSTSASRSATAIPRAGDRHRRRSAGGDEPVRQRTQRRARGRRDGRAGPVPERARHLHEQDRGRARSRAAPSTSAAAPPTTWPPSPRPSGCASPI